MKETLNPANVPPPLGHYSHCVSATGSRLIFVAGQVAVDDDGNVVGAHDIEIQARLVFTNIQKILEAAGAQMEDIVQLTIYDTDLAEHSERARRVRDEFLPKDFPAATKVEVQGLAHPDLMIEVEAVAVTDS